MYCHTAYIMRTLLLMLDMEVAHRDSLLLSTGSHCRHSALLKGTLNCRPLLPSRAAARRAAAPSGAGSPPGAPMMLFLLLIRLVASTMEAMCLQCQRGEHSNALQAPSRQPQGTQHTRAHMYTPPRSPYQLAARKINISS